MIVSESALLAQNAALMTLSKSRVLAEHGFESALCEIVTTAARTMHVERVGIWLFNHDRTAIRCVKLYEATEDCHSSGIEITAADYPHYFTALEENRSITADDAHTDPRTREFGTNYLIPLGITSMMDAPIRRSGELVGVVCHEHVGPSRTWSNEEEQFAGSIADFVAMALYERDRNALIEELERKNAELERFTYTVSHDLKSPLVTISGYAHYLEEDVDAVDKEKVSNDISNIQQGVAQMQRLLDDLLYISRVGYVVGPTGDVSLDEVVAEAMEATRGEREAAGVAVRAATGLPVVKGHRTRLMEVLQNLISNAVKFSAEAPGPQVEVGLRENDGKHVVVFVRDNGIGIEPRHHEKIFEPFAKIDPERGGAGIGLAVAKRIVEAHGGRLWVESEGPGKGAVFCFSLPVMGKGNEV